MKHLRMSLSLKKRNVSPGKAKRIAGVKRRSPYTNSDSEEEEENAELPKKQSRQIRSSKLQMVTRNSKAKADWMDGF